ncbi:MAG: hypothetical protein ABIC40_08215, partial [bacterium]
RDNMKFIIRYRFLFQHCAIIAIAAAFAFILIPDIAHANSMAPATFTFLSGPPQRVIPIMVVVSILIVLIESLFLWKMLAIGFWGAVWISFVANVISSVFGLIIMGLHMVWDPTDISSYLSYLISIAIIIWCLIKRREIPKLINIVIILCMLAGPLLFLLLIRGGINFLRIFTIWEFPVSVLSALGLSVIVEGETVKRFLGRSNIWTPVFLGNIVTYILLIAITANLYVPAGSRQPAWESRAKGTLRSMGSTQLAYQNTNEGKLYGSFEALKREMYIAEGYNEGNMIENYSMTWQVNNISTMQSEQFPMGLMSTFTVIAYPRDTREGYLSTFGVTDDQKVRKYNPKNKNRYGNVRTWDPIL